MSAHVLFCRDLAVRDEAGDRITRVEGWCTATATIEALLLKTGQAAFQVVPFGFARPDVGTAFPAYAHAEKSGFRFIGSIECCEQERAILCAQVRSDPLRSAEWHAFPVRLDTSDIQTIECNADTRMDDEAEHAATELVAPENLEARFRRSLQENGGVTLRLDIINKCNLRCVMCHFSDDAVFKRPTRQLTGEQFKELFNQIGPHVGQVALSCGDEPLTSKFLPDILRYLATEHPHVAIEFCTNAMLMGPRIRDLIIEARVARLLFSVDAVTKPMLESVRVGCRYEQVIGNILALRDLKRRHHTALPVYRFNYVLMNRNIHEAPAFVRVAKTLGAEAVDFRHMVPIPPYFAAEDQLSLHPAKYNYYRNRIIAAAREAGLAYYLPAAFPTDAEWWPQNEIEISFSDFERVLAEASQVDTDSTEGVPEVSLSRTRARRSMAEEFGGTFCDRPFSEILVRDQEEVLPCGWHEKTLGRLSEGKSLSEIFLGAEFAALRRNMLKREGDPGCARCPIKTAHLPTAENR